uniref:G-protein coupled receptors family 1 profile domain-containing protein n=1 Tax=Glossina morsitans morsitans TaxID=37546 RepID=A0A1A9YUJ7_GLOMM
MISNEKKITEALENIIHNGTSINLEKDMRRIPVILLMSFITHATTQTKNGLYIMNSSSVTTTPGTPSTSYSSTPQILKSLTQSLDLHLAKDRKKLMLLKTLANFKDQFLPTLDLLHLNGNEFYKHINISMLDAEVTAFNYSLLNASLLYENDDENDACTSGQHNVITLIAMILYSLVCVVGLFGNTLVIYVILRFSKMQTVTNIYILNLAIADECFLICIPFLLYTMQIGSWQFGEYPCKAYMVSTSITQFTSSIFLLIMSADRYIAVCHPISSPRYRTPLVSKIVSVVAWLTSVLLMVPVILFASTIKNGERLTCNIRWPETEYTQSGITFILYTLTLGFALPLTFILGFYYLVIRKLRTVGPKHKSKEKKRSHRKVTKLVLTVITVYILCWLPYWVCQVALIASPAFCASRLEITIFLLVSCLGYSNSAMNPVLYAFLSDNFKKSFMKACVCATRKDVNAQLQVEHSMFPKWSKARSATESNIRSSQKHKENNTKKQQLITSSNINGKGLMKASTTATTSVTCTTTVTTNEACNIIYPSSVQHNNSLLTAPLNTSTLSITGTAKNTTLLMLNNSMETNKILSENTAEAENNYESHVIHTNL